MLGETTYMYHIHQQNSTTEKSNNQRSNNQKGDSTDSTGGGRYGIVRAAVRVT